MRPPEKIHDPVYEKPSEVQFKIDKDIPLPPDMRSRVSKYPWGMMEVGDSLFLPIEEGDDGKRMKNRIAQSCRNFGKKQEPEWKYTLRYRLENEVSGVRIWRSE
tara:strand:- start:2 stop:313 length:312 start_codon:yes stop_codon:yes gene_type:complete